MIRYKGHMSDEKVFGRPVKELKENLRKNGLAPEHAQRFKENLANWEKGCDKIVDRFLVMMTQMPHLKSVMTEWVHGVDDMIKNVLQARSVFEGEEYGQEMLPIYDEHLGYLARKKREVQEALGVGGAN